MEEVKLNSPNSGVMIYQSDTFHKTSQALHSCLRFSHLGVPKWALWIRSWNYIMSKASFGCCHPSTLCSSPTGSKEPEHLFFRPPATPSNRQWIDDEAHISDPHWLAPGGPTRRELASDASFPVQKHFVLSPIIYTIFPNFLTLVHCDIPRATRRSPFYFPAPHQSSP